MQGKVSGASVTVHEYVSAVHPWLIALRDRILDANARLQGRSEPWPPETKLAVVQAPTNGPLSIDKGETWAKWHKKPQVPPPPGERLSYEERARRAKERALARSAGRIREMEAAAAGANQAE
ncbi:hypothetical protein MCOR25_002226 [Pyricularia grisea]|nr:hypothetical protein MCOR25_002226 [Pyricularia grisea]